MRTATEDVWGHFQLGCKFLPRCMKCRRGLAMRILSVRLSVRPSVTRVIPDKMEERSVQIYIPYEITFILVFWEEERLVGGDPFYLKFWVNRPHWNEIADFQPIIARNASAVTPSEKVQLTLIGSRIWAFDWYQTRWPWMTLNGVMALEAHFRLTRTEMTRDQTRVLQWNF